MLHPIHFWRTVIISEQSSGLVLYLLVDVILDDQAFQSFKALYIWWFALKFCYLFCGKLQEENRSKINKKLKQLMEKKDNMDEN